MIDEIRKYEEKILFDKAEFKKVLEEAWSERKGLSLMDIEVLLDVMTPSYHPIIDFDNWFERYERGKKKGFANPRDYIKRKFAKELREAIRSGRNDID